MLHNSKEANCSQGRASERQTSSEGKGPGQGRGLRVVQAPVTCTLNKIKARDGERGTVTLSNFRFTTHPPHLSGSLGSRCRQQEAPLNQHGNAGDTGPQTLISPERSTDRTG